MVESNSYLPDSEISQVSDFTTQSCCYRWTLGLLVFAYGAVLTTAHVLAFIEAYDIVELNEDGEEASQFSKYVSRGWFLLLYIPLINFILMLAIGRYIILSFIIYPY